MKIILILLMILCSSCAGIRSRYHRVGKGESLASIAARYAFSTDLLRDHNHRLSAEVLRVGTKVYLPFEESGRWNDDLEDSAGEDAKPQPERREPSAVTFAWPLRGAISSPFGKRRSYGIHDGIDIVARSGTPIAASRSGHVIYRSNRIGGYGNMVIIKHADAFATVYAHLSKYLVKKGQFVTRGQVIGRVGRTGRASGSHLHFEIRNDRIPVNPLLYLQGQYAANILTR